MKYTPPIKKAIKFAAKTHSQYQQQTRKGKVIPYITHPLTVGLILALAGASEAVIVAGILHDTIEDSIDAKKVTPEMLTERFGKKVTGLVMSVTEQDKSKPWNTRKREALEHIAEFSRDSLLLKSADVLSNISELIDDHNRYGDKVFKHFSATKEKTIKNFEDVVKAILKKWKGNPLGDDLGDALEKMVIISKT